MNNKNKTKHIKKAEEILQKIDTTKLGDIMRARHDYDFIVQYPPPLTLRPIAGETIHT